MLPPVDNETRLQPLSVRELLTATLTERPRITLHELERAAALQGHSSIEVEIVLKSFLRDRLVERVSGFQLRDPNSDVCEGDTELCAPRTVVTSIVDLAQISREVAAAAIAKASQASNTPRRQLCERDLRGFWREVIGTLDRLPVGQTHHLIHPDRTPALLAKQSSVMLCNWRRAKMLAGHFKCRRSVQGVLITRLS